MTGSIISQTTWLKNWLLIGCFLIGLMVLVGGITRLTESGLSIVEWNVVSGTLAPLSETDWQQLFEKYKQSPQFKVVNFEFTIHDFKTIFWWEYFHRLLGRVIGLFFLAPILVLVYKKQYKQKVFSYLLILFLLILLQGFMGWYMVKSGLLKEPNVSHIRLAMHLFLAFFTFALSFWTAKAIGHQFIPTPKPLRLAHLALLALLGLVFAQVCAGALVAGLRAGRICNTFPLMCNDWLPDPLFDGNPAYNLFMSLQGVQFLHRVLAFNILLSALGLFIFLFSNPIFKPLRRPFFQLVGMIIFQFSLGVFTLLSGTNFYLSLLHQTTALVVIAFCINVVHHICYQKTPKVVSLNTFGYG